GRIVQAATPIEVYRNPASRFVGGFIGSPPMNFLPARRRDGGWRVAGIDVAGPVVDRDEIEFGIRPEDVAPAEAGLVGAVRVVEPLGAHKLVTMTVADTLFRALVDSDLAVHPGETLTLVPRPERVRWFDLQSGAAIP
ncbi:MAG: TOBE domain-containing protein, partial [Bauldia sp.]|nr:TOBE domain-containing protein [Bauldia sp.]